MMNRAGQAHAAERDRRRAERRSELVSAALRVIRREGPGVSMERLAAEAGVTKPILYRHFGDRAGLHAAVLDEVFTGLGAGIDAALGAEVPPRQLVANAIDTYLAFVERDPEVYRFLTAAAEQPEGHRKVNEFLERVGREVALVLGEGLRAVRQDSGPAEAWAYGIVGMVFASGDWWLERRTVPRARLCEYLTQLVCDGLPDFAGTGDLGHADPTGEVVALAPRTRRTPA